MNSIINNISTVCMLSMLIIVACCNNNRGAPSADTMAADSVPTSTMAGKEADNNVDSDFAGEVAMANYNEIAMANLATKKTSDPQVKELAQMLDQDHSRALRELETLATSKGITLPSTPDKKPEHEMENLQKENDINAFNKKWCEEMVSSHEKTINKFENYVEKANDADLKAWAVQTLPTLRMHLEKAKACEEHVKDKNS